MGFKSFMQELEKIAQMPVGAPAAQKGMVRKIHEWIKKNPGKSGVAAGWVLRGLLSGRDE